MANHKSAEKRHRQSLKRRTRNRVTKAAIRTVIKKSQAAIETKDIKGAKELARQAEVLIARAASKGIFHKKTAQRYISRVSSAVSAK